MDEGLYNSVPLAEEKLSADGCEGNGNQFFSGVWSLLFDLASVGAPEGEILTQFSVLFLKGKKMVLEEGCGGGIPEELKGEEVECE